VTGTRLGHYQILESLGKGGMGEVYAAEDLRLGRRVALKVLSRELALDADRRERFEREARAVAALNHPNIVTIYSVEDADGTPFLTLELVDGRTLDALIPPRGLPLERLLTYAIPLADAVGAAHQRGITHRDLKPGNVMISEEGRVKVLDFGLAKLKESAATLAASLPTQQLTGEGRIVGTVAYMSPEQAEGRPVEPRSDVFSLGVMLFEMATGERPFKGDTQVSLLSSIIKDTPASVTDLRNELPRDLARIVRRCLNKDPEDRYQSAKDLRNDLRALKEDLASGVASAPLSTVTSLPAPAVPARQPSRIWIPLAGVAGALIAAASVYVYWSDRGAPSTGGAETGTQRFTAIALNRLTTTGTAGLAAISDDGRYVAYVVTEEGKSGLWLRQVATTSNVSIVPPAEVRFSGVTFSPDGNHVYYSFYPAGEVFGNLYQVPVLGGGARRVVEDVDGGVSFDPQGTRFAFVRNMGATREAALIVADAGGSNLKTLVMTKVPNRFKVQSVAWSPDGRTIAVLSDRGEALQVDVVLVDVTTSTQTVLGNHAWRDVTHVAWLPDGKALLINAQEASGESTNQIWLVSVAGGGPRRITNDLSTYAGLSLTADGKSFVSVRNELRSRIWIVDAAGKESRAVSTGAAADDGVNGLAWTPDGRLVYTSASAGNLDIWIMDADGRNRVQLTSDKAHDTWPAVTPDGRRIVFVSERGGARALWVMGIDGGEQRRIGTVTVNPRPSLSADGKWIYYTDPGVRNFRIPVDGGDPVPVEVSPAAGAAAKPLPPRFHEPLLSPDGTMIAGHYDAKEQRGERIAVVPLDGSAPKLFPNVSIPAFWAGDGKSLLYVVARAGATNLWRQPIASGPAVQVTHFSDQNMFNGSLSPDQKRWAIVRGDISADVVLVSERH
jgi:Tol biopolymer transport system component